MHEAFGQAYGKKATTGNAIPDRVDHEILTGIMFAQFLDQGLIGLDTRSENIFLISP